MKKSFLPAGIVFLLLAGLLLGEVPEEKQTAERARKALPEGAEKAQARPRPAKTRSIVTGKNSSKRSESLLLSLPVRGEIRSGYNRDLFPHWSDLDGNGCDTREDILRRENRRPRGKVCWDRRGWWFSRYDGKRTRDSSQFDIDHIVPLAESWDSGAHAWSASRRERFANEPAALWAVSAESNRSKSDRDPASWMPPRESFHCRYARRWVQIKSRWKISIDPREKRALKRVLRGCR